jgi:hypothetical protein
MNGMIFVGLRPASQREVVPVGAASPREGEG